LKNTVPPGGEGISVDVLWGENVREKGRRKDKEKMGSKRVK
jgi:hypothetical protein